MNSKIEKDMIATWAQDQQIAIANVKNPTFDSTCPQCGDDNDLLVAITGKPCGKCTRKNHKKAMK